MRSTATIDSDLTTLRGAAVSQSGRLMVTYGVDALQNIVSVWDVAGRSLVQRFAPVTTPRMVRFVPDETALIGAVISQQADGVDIVRWSLSAVASSVASEGGSILFRQPHARGAALSRDARVAVIRLRDGGLVVFNVDTGKSVLADPETVFTGVCVSSSGVLIAAANENGISVLTSEGDSRPELAVKLAQTVQSRKPESMDCSDTTVVAAFDDTIETVWANPRRPVPVVRVPGPVRRIALGGADMGILAAAQGDHITLIDVTDGSTRGEIVTPSPAQGLAFSLTNGLLVTAHEDKVAQMWDLTTPRPPSDGWGRLAPAAMLAMAYADGFRAASGHSTIGMDDLVLGIYRADPVLARELSFRAGGAPDEEGYLDEIVGAALADATGVAPPEAPAATAVISMPALSSEVALALESADKAAAAAGFSEVQTTHIALGGFGQRDSPVVKALIDSGVNLDSVEDLLGRNPPPPGPAGQLLAAPAADTVPEPGKRRVREADRLGAAADVEMLVSVLLARDTPLPLAVGLFGNWGSGKSFFMALMQECITELSEAAAEAPGRLAVLQKRPPGPFQRLALR